MAEVVGTIILEALLAEATIFGTTAVVSSTTATLVGSTVLIGGSLIAGAILQRPPSQAGYSVPGPSDGTQTLKQAVPARQFGYGRTRMGGVYMLYESTVGGFSYDVIALQHGRIEAINYRYLNDDLIILEGSGFVSGVYTNSAAGSAERYFNSVGGGGGVSIGGGNYSYVRVQERLGAATETAYSGLVTALPDFWSNAHRGDGIASLFLQCAPTTEAGYFKTFPRGLPKLSVVADTTPVFDPRDAAQSRGDPTTWTASRNPVLQMLDLLTNSTHGLGLEWDDVVEPHLDALMAQADVCDEPVTLASGLTEPRYRSSGFATFETDPVEIIGSILSACDGWMAERGDGTISMIVGKYAAPTVTFTDAHIIGFSIEKGVPDEELVNELRFTYSAPGNDYREAAGDPWRDEDSITLVGKVRSQRLGLGWVQSHSQARRLVKRAMARNKAPMRGTLTTTLYGLVALGERWVALASTAVSDFENAVIEISRARVDITNGRVVFDWVLVDPDTVEAWTPTTDEGDPPELFGAITNLLKPTGVSAASASSRIRVTITDPSDSSLVYAIEYKLTSASEYTREYVLTYTPSGGSIELTTAATVAAGSYDVRVAAIDSEHIMSGWVTTTATI